MSFCINYIPTIVPLFHQHQDLFGSGKFYLPYTLPVLEFPLLPRSMPSPTSWGLSFSAIPNTVNVGTRVNVG